MRDVLPTLERWLAEGHRFALATVVRTWGSSPRPVGATMGVREDGAVVGSVSGGCVESAVVEGALDTLRTGSPKRMSFAGIDENTIWEIGLSCGGRIDAWIDPEPYRDAATWDSICSHVASDSNAVLISDLGTGEKRVWDSGAPQVGAHESYAASILENGESREAEIEGQSLFFQVLAGRERLLIVGASHIALPLVQMAKVLGFETIVVDPRSQLLAPERFPDPPDRIHAGWPGPILAAMQITERTYAVVLSHDPKIDDAALEVLLRSPAAYIGALGSKVTQEKRRESLRALGFGDPELGRIHGPVGLRIGARSPEEIALSILAEIVQVRRARS